MANTTNPDAAISQGFDVSLIGQFTTTDRAQERALEDQRIREELDRQERLRRSGSTTTTQSDPNQQIISSLLNRIRDQRTAERIMNSMDLGRIDSFTALRQLQDLLGRELLEDRNRQAEDEARQREVDRAARVRAEEAARRQREQLDPGNIGNNTRIGQADVPPEQINPPRQPSPRFVPGPSEGDLFTALQFVLQSRPQSVVRTPNGFKIINADGSRMDVSIEQAEGIIGQFQSSQSRFQIGQEVVGPNGFRGTIVGLFPGITIRNANGEEQTFDPASVQIPGESGSSGPGNLGDALSGDDIFGSQIIPGRGDITWESLGVTPPAWWPEGMAPPFRIDGNDLEGFSIQLDTAAFDRIFDQVAAGGFGPELQLAAGVSPETPEEAFLTLEQQLAQAILDGDIDRAESIAGILDRPDANEQARLELQRQQLDNERFQMGLDLARSPASSLAVSLAQAGLLPQTGQGQVGSRTGRYEVIDPRTGEIVATTDNPATAAEFGLEVRPQVIEPNITRLGPVESFLQQAANDFFRFGDAPQPSVNPFDAFRNLPQPPEPATGQGPARPGGSPGVGPVGAGDALGPGGPAANLQRLGAFLNGQLVANIADPSDVQAIQAQFPGIEIRPLGGQQVSNTGVSSQPTGQFASLNTQPQGESLLDFLPIRVRQVLSDQTIDRPQPLLPQVGIRPLSAQTIRRLGPTELESLRGLTELAGIPRAEFDRELQSQIPLAGRPGSLTFGGNRGVFR
ncbi:MAG: hypothetical protein GWN86_06880 [Desulfobacterales bacterium]|nr:hypothetical protein [Desulfobacterales bacterium]